MLIVTVFSGPRVDASDPLPHPWPILEQACLDAYTADRPRWHTALARTASAAELSLRTLPAARGADETAWRTAIAQGRDSSDLPTITDEDIRAGLRDWSDGLLPPPGVERSLFDSTDPVQRRRLATRIRFRGLAEAAWRQAVAGGPASMAAAIPIIARHAPQHPALPATAPVAAWMDPWSVDLRARRWLVLDLTDGTPRLGSRIRPGEPGGDLLQAPTTWELPTGIGPGRVELRWRGDPLWIAWADAAGQEIRGSASAGWVAMAGQPPVPWSGTRVRELWLTWTPDAWSLGDGPRILLTGSCPAGWRPTALRLDGDAVHLDRLWWRALP